ncbi:tetratricopeptide repeat protein [Methylopila henanensis]|uniref:Tetratricopeptide repeat protein n=1 Tax=Methylopila henanensis TaxID=873516 RepID=A0ABW4K5U8_9HYPH
MTRFAQSAALAALLSLGGALAAMAQPALPPDASPEGSTPTLPAPPPAAPPPADAPSAADQGKAVDALLERLAKTEDPAAARRIAGAVQALWMRSGSDTADLLTSRALEAQRKAKADVAIKLMDRVVSLRPEFAEGWNRRATLHFLGKDYDRAMMDLREALVREPRHFGAWLGLGRILRESGLDKPALGAFRKALAIHPQIDGLKREVDELTLKVEGQPI